MRLCQRNNVSRFTQLISNPCPLILCPKPCCFFIEIVNEQNKEHKFRLMTGLLRALGVTKYPYPIFLKNLLSLSLLEFSTPLSLPSSLSANELCFTFHWKNESILVRPAWFTYHVLYTRKLFGPVYVVFPGLPLRLIW